MHPQSVTCGSSDLLTILMPRQRHHWQDRKNRSTMDFDPVSPNASIKVIWLTRVFARTIAKRGCPTEQDTTNKISANNVGSSGSLPWLWPGASCDTLDIAAKCLATSLSFSRQPTLCGRRFAVRDGSELARGNWELHRYVKKGKKKGPKPLLLLACLN